MGGETYKVRQEFLCFNDIHDDDIINRYHMHVRVQMT